MAHADALPATDFYGSGRRCRRCHTMIEDDQLVIEMVGQPDTFRHDRCPRYDYQVAVPEGECDGMRVERFTVEEDASNLSFIQYRGRGVEPGTYTRLMAGKTVWMSDTRSEWRDHYPAVYQIRQSETKWVLINGLGLGMVVKAALDQPHVERVDVVEIDPRVIKLVGPTYLADPRVTIHEEDALKQMKLWPTGAQWDVVWHDIWPTICEDNLAEMSRLHRSYGRRADWQGSWSRESLLAQRNRDRQHRIRWGLE